MCLETLFPNKNLKIREKEILNVEVLRTWGDSSAEWEECVFVYLMKWLNSWLTVELNGMKITC